MIVGIIDPLEAVEFGVGFDSFLECDVQYFNVLFGSLPRGEWFMKHGDSYIKIGDNQAERHSYNEITVHNFHVQYGALIDEAQFERLGLTSDDLIS